MILLYQITHSNTGNLLLDLFTTASVATTRGHNFKFLSHFVILVVTLTPFLAELLIIGIIVNANSVNSFKNLLDNFWTNNIFIVT